MQSTHIPKFKRFQTLDLLGKSQFLSSFLYSKWVDLNSKY